MNQFFENIKIENFKSLRHTELKDCKRINIFIGKPNVGKSNILEALSLFSIEPNDSTWLNSLKTLIRFNDETELFFDGEDDKTIRLDSNLWKLSLNHDFQKGILYQFHLDLGDLATNLGRSSIKKYIFNENISKNLIQDGNVSNHLLPPNGSNLLNILQKNRALLTECRNLFKAYRLELLFDKSSKSLRIAKRIGKDSDDLPAIFTMPYASIADTLQRVIFHKAAILSNNNSILLFEEPEAHSFPPHIVHITQEIIYSKTNQFFVTTHSPFVLNDFLENAREDLAVYLVDWQDGETTIKRLSDDDIYEIYQYGIDIFTNLETFI